MFMKIHFVSYGHAFRSRVAEAYLKYLLRKYKNIDISSSGIILENDVNGPIAWYAMKILAQHSLVPYMSLEPVKTSKEILNRSDSIIFCDSHSHEYSERKYGFTSKKYEVWNLGYIMPDKVERGIDREHDLKIIKESEEIFTQIKENCRRIYNYLSVTDIPFEE